jgi:hypothetical protein
MTTAYDDPPANKMMARATKKKGGR